MVREQFDYDLKSLQDKIIELGKLAEIALQTSMKGLQLKDVDFALQVIDNDYKSDNLEEEINDLAVMLITKQQPVATDLRRIFSSVKIASDLERISDHAVNIAKATIRLGAKELSISLDTLEEMYIMSQKMLTLCIQAYQDENLVFAKQVAEMDDVVDELYGKAVRELMVSIPEQPKDINQITQLSFVARYIERVADHITNVAENIFYLVKGKHYLLNE